MSQNKNGAVHEFKKYVPQSALLGEFKIHSFIQALSVAPL